MDRRSWRAALIAASSWVSRRLALVDLLPEAIQQQVREGKLSAHVAMKFLVPVARVSLEDCKRMAAAFARHHCNTRQAGQLYAAWRDASPLTRQRLLDQPELFFKTQPPAEPQAPPAGAAALLRDLEMATAIFNRARRRLAGAGAAEMDRPQRQAVRGQIEHLRQQLNRLAERIPEEEEPDVEPIPTDHHSGTEHQQGVSKRQIARVLGISRLAVRQRPALEFPPGAGTPPPRESRTLPASRSWSCSPRCKGNLVRVHEELVASGAPFSYQALTAFCRRHGIGQAPPVPAGQYHFEPGEEMQHDTSPHELELAGKKRKVQTASAVLCYSRMLFFQCYPTFQRFDCKVFLTAALRYFAGAPGRVMIDNTHVVVLRGTGREMVPVPEMAAFAERFGFHFVAHAIGDANRSGRVERPFSFHRRITSWPGAPSPVGKT